MEPLTTPDARRDARGLPSSWETEWSEDSATGEAEGGGVTHTNRATEAIVELKPTKELEQLNKDPWIHPRRSFGGLCVTQ